MKSNKFIFVYVAILIIALLSGCSSNTTENTVSANQLEEMPYDMSPQQVYEAAQTGDVMILDVREIWEFEEGHISDAVLIPFLEIENRLSEIPKDQHIIVTCRSGNRSSQIAELLTDKGYTKVHNMAGGILAWNTLNLPIEK